MAKLKGKTLKL
ncbi:hypothetical protein VTL71DRAFT_4272 [Oculimacula yallundae]|uniref:Uncharacterized protein n=1 Tax=Oculimacula yallundae TaxID=86028 RepID=A0ABR4C732_9HELO